MYSIASAVLIALNLSASTYNPPSVFNKIEPDSITTVIIIITAVITIDNTLAVLFFCSVGAYVCI